jgi:hypothetical protein
MTTAIVIKLCRKVSRVRSDKSTDNPLPEVGVGVSSPGGVMITTAITPSGVKLEDPPVPGSEVGVGEIVVVGILGSTIELFGGGADRFTGLAWCTLPGWDRGRGDILCAGDLVVGEYLHKPATRDIAI